MGDLSCNHSKQLFGSVPLGYELSSPTVKVVSLKNTLKGKTRDY